MRRITEQPFKGIVDREWIRAKRILPVLKKKPTVKWAMGKEINHNANRSGCVGYCYRRDNLIVLHEGYKNFTDHKEFVMTLRHEFAHLPKTSGASHGADFVWWMTKLGGTRYSKYYQHELEQRPKRTRRWYRRPMWHFTKNATK